MEELTLQQSIELAVKNYLTNSRKSSGEHTPKERKFYVSDMGKCFRTRFLKRKGISGEYGFETYYTFALGDFIHDLGYKALEAADMLIATEQRLEDEHFVGKYDGKVRYQGKEIMFDFKSTNPYVMKRITSGAGDNTENIMQVLTYIYFERKINPKINDTGALVYFNKLPSAKIDPTIIKVKEYHYNTYKKLIEEDMKKILDYWLTDKIPPCTCPSWSMQQYNSYYMFCRMDEKEIKKYLAMLKAGNIVSSDGYKINVQKSEGKEVEL